MLCKGRYIAGFSSILLIGSFFILPVIAQAASLYFSPSSVSRSGGQTFSATIRVNTEGQAINAAQGGIVYDPAKVEVVSVSKAGSIFNLWTQDPTFSNSEGTLAFEGGLPSPGYSGSSGLIFTISFKAKAGGSGSSGISLVSGAILANDGQGTNILTSLGKLTLTISSAPDTSQPAATPVPDTGTSGSDIPKVESSTHADPTKWYSNDNPSFSWNLPSDVTGVSYLITDKETSNPGPKSDGVLNKASFTGISDGTQYLHVKFKQDGVWGAIAHYRFNIDTKAPAAFDIQTSTADSIHPEVTFETSDALSGIDHYEIKIGDNAWTTLSADQAGKPYRLSFDRIGTQTVSVKAVDKAGNATTESASVTVSGAAVGASATSWIARLFNMIVNSLSRYGLLLALLAAMVGVLILIYQFLGSNIDKVWHRMDNRRVVRKTERKVDTTLDRIIKDMGDELSFLQTIGKRRRLGPEEKYLKTKLEQYMKALKK